MSAARQLPAQGDRSTPLARVLDLLVDAFAERVAAALDRILRDRAAQADEAWGLTSQKTPSPTAPPPGTLRPCPLPAVTQNPLRHKRSRKSTAPHVESSWTPAAFAA